MRSQIRRVSSSDVPSGARTYTSNSAMSFSGWKPFGTLAAIGKQEPIVTSDAIKMTQRCIITQRSTRM